MSIEVGCLSFRQPYAGLVLNGVKSLETRWRPLLAQMKNCTLAIHIAQKDWEGEEWRNILREHFAMRQSEIEELLESGERFGRGVVAGLVDVGETWFCSEDVPPEQTRELEKAACLTGLAQKYLTRLSSPRWLTEPLYSRGHKDIWMIRIPAHLAPVCWCGEGRCNPDFLLFFHKHNTDTCFDYSKKCLLKKRTSHPCYFPHD